MDLAEFRYAPYGKALKRHSNQRKIKLDNAKKRYYNKNSIR